MGDLLELLPQAAPELGPWVLVTLTGTQGSTYRREGAHLLVHAQGWKGMLSGGCLEAEVAARCAPVLAGEVPSLEVAIETRKLLGCHGALTLLVEPLPPTLTGQVARVERERRPLTLFSHRPGPGWRPTSPDSQGEFAHQVLPPSRLLVFGSGPGAAPLRKLGAVLGWRSEQIVLSSDPAAARADAGWVVLSSRELSRIEVDRRTACVIMNHNVGRDSEVLCALWTSETPFVGLLGSRRRRDEILARLSFEHDLLDLGARELYAPVGLDLGAEGGAEIGLEICAQIQRVFAQHARTVSLPTAAPGSAEWRDGVRTA